MIKNKKLSNLIVFNAIESQPITPRRVQMGESFVVQPALINICNSCRRDVHNVSKHFTNLMDITKTGCGFAPSSVLLIDKKLKKCLLNGVTTNHELYIQL